MAGPIGTVSGLSSGIQWRDLIDQIMQAEQAKSLTPVATRQTVLQTQSTAWTNFQALAAKIRDASAALRESTAFDVFSAVAGKSPSTSRDLLSATATTDASPGTYGIEVLGIARAEKLGGSFVASSATALGVAGDFTLNGVLVTIGASDSLIAVRDKINAANSGANPSGVGATILSTAAGSHLVLSNTATGATGIETVDGATGAFQALGFTDGTTQANITAAGSTQTYRVSSATLAIGAYLGIAAPAASSIKVGGTVVTVDLATDSLSTIAARINTATGNPAAATVVSETVAGKTTYRLVTNSTVAADGSVNLADSTRALAELGFTRSGHAGVTQVIKSANTFVDAGTALNATGAALLTALETNGQTAGITATDTINISGTRGDGTTFTSTLVVGAGTTMQDLLDAVTAAGAGGRAATASLAAGRIALTDATAGDSELSLSLTVTTAGGSTTSLGAFSTAGGGVSGLTRQMASGADARFRVDGQLVTRSTNSVSDAISGVTLNLLTAEQGTSVPLTISRNTSAIVQKVKDLAAAYNNARAFIKTSAADKASLAHNGALRAMGSALTDTILGTVTGLTGGFTTAGIVGLQHDANGVLSLNETTFSGYLQTNFADVKKLFTLTATPSDSEVSFLTAGTNAKPTDAPYAVAIAQAATQAAVTGAIWPTYSTVGAPDTMTITDASTGVTGAITLANGDAIATTVQKLNSLFAANKMQLTATLTGDSRVSITGTGYGSGAGFTVAYTPGAGGDGTATLGIAAQSYAGLNVAGSINGVAATGQGQYLTGAVGDPSEGLVLRYTGTTARAAGTVAFSIGLGGALASLATGLADPISGTVTTAASTAKQQAADLTGRISDLQRRLDSRRAALTAQFLAMESALTKAQGIGGALAAQINALQSNSG